MSNEGACILPNEICLVLKVERIRGRAVNYAEDDAANDDWDEAEQTTKLKLDPSQVHPFAAIDKFLDRQLRQCDLDDEGSDALTEAHESKSSIHYLVKWKGKSYLHCSWLEKTAIEEAAKVLRGLRVKLNKFDRDHATVTLRNDTDDGDRVSNVILSEWCTVDRIIARSKRKRHAEAPVEAKSKKTDFQAFTETPGCLSGGVLHPYQIDGLNWLRFARQQQKHVILADEMGLGKTVQSVAFLAAIRDEGQTPPHLVVAPLSTLRNWEREFAIWAPDMNVVMYAGNGPARAIIRQHEFYFPIRFKRAGKGPKREKSKVAMLKKSVHPLSSESKQKRIKFDVLLTSYEMVNQDSSVLRSITWECMIVDEGHRLKSRQSRLFQALRLYNTQHRILLTGTPLQNNLDELFMLMHFLDATKFSSLEHFKSEFKDLGQEEQVGRLHKMLAPHLLRRLKKDVLKEMPAKKELIVRVELSSTQKEYYKAVLTRNYEVLTRHGGHYAPLKNVVMELRKICGHPSLLEKTEWPHNNEDAQRTFVEASGKLSLLDRMMVKLKVQEHRVLIYSQFTRVLDLLEDWLYSKGWSYERIDGSVSGTERQVRIDRFNAPDSTRFCFLLSTRAGGLGINLATADTVIIYDSDWNPHADLQAMARAHRLGQKDAVMIYRLVTRGTVEERMMQLTKKKMVLEHLVVGRMKSSQILQQDELDDILRYGATELFAEDTNDEELKLRQIKYDDAAIDRLLDRSQMQPEEEANEDEENQYLTAFKVANFEYVAEEERAALEKEEAERLRKADEQLDLDAQGRATIWEGLLGISSQQQQTNDTVELGKGRRSRKEVNYVEGGQSSLRATESAWEGPPEEKSASNPVDRVLRRRKARGALTPMMEGEGEDLLILGFNGKQRAHFLATLLKYGISPNTFKHLQRRLHPKSVYDIQLYASLFLSHLAEEDGDGTTFHDGTPKEGLRVTEVLVRLAALHNFQQKVREMETGQSTTLPSIQRKRHRGTHVWRQEHDLSLIRGIIRHGYGRWHSIAIDKNLGLLPVLQAELNITHNDVPATLGGLEIEATPGEAVATGDAEGIEAATNGTAADTVRTEATEQLQEEACELTPELRSDKENGAVRGEGAGAADMNGVKDAGREGTLTFLEQRRIMFFVKNRVAYLERVLHTEYSRRYQKAQRPIAGQLQEVDAAVGKSTFLPIELHEVVTARPDQYAKCAEVAEYYNQMCEVLQEGGSGNGAELTNEQLDRLGHLCQQMRNALKIASLPQHPSSAVTRLTPAPPPTNVIPHSAQQGNPPSQVAASHQNGGASQAPLHPRAAQRSYQQAQDRVPDSSDVGSEDSDSSFLEEVDAPPGPVPRVLPLEDRTTV
eukprot:SM000212S06901  [mRNA]  locus=s212:113572:124037:+ [translate_table: standard]